MPKKISAMTLTNFLTKGALPYRHFMKKTVLGKDMRDMQANTYKHARSVIRQRKDIKLTGRKFTKLLSKKRAFRYRGFRSENGRKPTGYVNRPGQGHKLY